MSDARLRCAAVVAWALLPALSQAGTHWRCELTGDLLQLSCRVEVDAATATASSSASTAEVNGTRFPLDPARRWLVDLWSPPTEMDRVRQLARATICYRSPDCTVDVVDMTTIAAR
ncbi:MAG: hypothetical protein OEU94_08470 [Aquincola sp.]|nr:hypothetical protein [Aquincola sp.]MDH4288339.1 hypothetical protein [Aquincola sp.]MDH5330880.1 hypothetical protein [Aquincola sp.]